MLLLPLNHSRYLSIVKKQNSQVYDRAQRVLVTGGAGYIGWHHPSPFSIDH